MAKGRFITLEGGEGAGKTTQIGLLEAYLKDQGYRVVTTREPGGSQGAEQIRSLLVEGDKDRWDGMTEALLNFAARRDHLVKKIMPALERGDWVISDRFADSTIAYQGYAYGFDLKKLEILWDLSIDGFKPDLTFMFDIDIELGVQRAMDRGGKENRYESMDKIFHNKVRNGFLEIARLNPNRCHVIDASQSINEINDALITQVKKHLIGA